jgi:cell pole-organizing protein PopZ
LVLTITLGPNEPLSTRSTSKVTAASPFPTSARSTHRPTNAPSLREIAASTPSIAQEQARAGDPATKTIMATIATTVASRTARRGEPGSVTRVMPGRYSTVTLFARLRG